MVLSITELVIGYGSPLCSPIELQLGPGESIALMGRSGVGKTTLLRTILGMQRPLSGQVSVCGIDVHKAKYRELSRLRGQSIGTVFQHGELLGTYTAEENIALPRLLMNRNDDEAMSNAAALALQLGIEPKRLARDLSGGERQRVALARALINHPKLILADEPTGSLDPYTRDQVLPLLFDTSKEEGAALLVVTHDDEVAKHANKILTMGVQDGT